MIAWLKYIIETSQNNHRVTIHKIHRWIHSEVTYTSTISRSHQYICQDNHHHILHNIFNDFKDIYQYIISHTKIKDELYPWETCSITRETQKHEPYLFDDHNMKKQHTTKNKLYIMSSHIPRNNISNEPRIL